jgi:hypothetical protein
VVPLSAAFVLSVTTLAGATPSGGWLVTVGSPPSPFPQNKQNKPAAVVNPAVPSIAAAGANDEIDLEACNNRDDKTCPFTAGVSVSGIYFSDDGGSSWLQPTYTGWTARDCLGVVGTQPANPADNCDPHVGPIGTLPRYYERGLVADGDPALGFGPRRGPDARFAWANGWRLYYASLAANFGAERSEAGFKGFEALTDEFLGDYDYAFATNDAVLAVWNDARNGADCPAIDAYRQDVVNGTAEGVSTDPTRPAPQQDCPATFGNTDIFGGSYADPTP